MSKKRILSWKPNWSERSGGGRWYKYVNGTIHYFGYGRSRDDAEARCEAERKYLDFMRRQQTTRPVEIRLADATISQVCEKYMQQLKDRHDRGEITASYFEQARCNLRDFTSAVGSGKRMTCIGELDLEEYRNYILALPVSAQTDRRISIFTAKGRLKAVRAVFRWAWKMHILENLPRNIDDIGKLPNGSTPQPEPKPFTMDELKTIWELADSRTRCFIALGLNVGMYQKDVSDLLDDHVDWESGYIDRPRCKTKIQAKHKLWPLTLELMKLQRSPQAAPGKRVFLSNEYRALDGTMKVREGAKPLPLVRRELDERGKFHHSDAVKSAFERVQRKIGINGGRGFSSLRDTGSCLVEQIDPLATEMYLSHSEPGMKKHYAQRDWARLERALVEMEERLGGVLRG